MQAQQVLVTVGLGVVGPVVLALTLFKSQFAIGDLWGPVAHQQRSLDLQLFNGFVDPSIWYGPWANSVGNILLFLPIGAAASLFLEVAQLVFAVGCTNVDFEEFASHAGPDGVYRG